MTKHSWIRKLFTRPAIRTVRMTPSGFRPALEALEDRTLLTTFTPSIFTDGGAGSGSLRAAVIAANADAGAATDTISLSAGTYALTLQGGGENAAATGDLDVTSKAHKLIIQGNGSTGANTTVIDASALNDRVFQIVNAGTIVEFDNLVITGGTAQDDGTAGATAGSTIAVGGGVLNNGGNLTFNNVVFQSNTAQGGVAQDADGGAIYSNGGSVALNNSTLSSNTVTGGQADSTTSAHGGFGQGGGLYANGVTTTITASTFDGNSATGGSSLGGSPTAGAGAGGGLYSSGGGTTIQTSTFSNNQAIGGPGQRVSQSFTGAGDSFGGGLYAVGSTTQVEVSTFFNNIASGQGESANLGGGLFASGGSATVVACTLSNNFAYFFDTTGGPKMQVIDGPPLSFGDGLYAESGAAVTLSNTIVAGVAPLYILGTGIPLTPTPGSGGVYTQPDVTLAGGHNLIQDGSGGFADTIKADPLFAALGNYGGPTETLALLPESFAIGAGSAVTGLTTDQRGVARTGSFDIGAFQSRGFTVTATGDGQSAYVGTAFAKGLIVTVSSAFNEPVAGGKVTFAVDPAAPGAPSAAFRAGDVTIAADGTATPQMAVDVFGNTVPLLPIANAVTGQYTSITATTSRANTVGFTLTNLALPNVIDATILSDGLAPGTLRGAVSAFNTDPGAGTDTINLQAGTYALTSGGDLDITNTAHKLIIQGQGTIGPNATIIDASALNDRVFNIVNAGTIVEFDNLVIKGGTAHDNGTEATATSNVGPTNAEGGGVLDNGGNLTFNNVVFDSNTAQAGNTSLAIAANGGPGLDALGGAIYAGAGSVLSISNTTFSSNRVVGGKGGLSETIGRAPLGTVHGGVGGAGRGGALYATGASVTINGSTFSSNQAVGGVGGDAFSSTEPPFDLFSGAPGGVGEGGGLVALNSGVLTIANSTFFANSAQGGKGTAADFTVDFPGGEPGGAGGDGLAGAASLGNEPITISNSTFSANTALGGSGGAGGFDEKTPGDPRTQGATGAAGNGQTGGILFASAATLNNTIVAGDAGGDVTVSGGALVGGHNLIQDGSGGLADTIKADPMLGSLADNGGPTPTLALLSGSPAIRAGGVALIPAGVTTDQRGLPRTVSNTVDIGAFENRNSAPSPTFSSLSSQSIVYGTSMTTLTGNIGSGGSFPTGSSVSVTLNSVTQTAVVDGSGNFTTTFDTSSLGVGSGPYTVTYAFAGNADFGAATDTSTTVTVGKADETVVVTPYNVKYDGSVHTATYTITGVNGETGAAVGTVDVSGTTHTDANPSGYSDSWSFTPSANYNVYSGDTAITDVINKADATVVVTPYDVTYDGNAHSATVALITGVNGETGATVGTVTIPSPPETNAGFYGDFYRFTGGANYNDIGPTGFGTDAIEQAPSTVVVTINRGPFTYNGLEQTPAIVSVTGAGGLNLTPTAIYTNNVNAGTATASYTYAGDQNHTGSSDSKNFIIDKADAAFTVTPYTVKYDGNPHTAAVTTITGVNGETGATVGAVTLNSTHTNAGPYANDSWSFAGASNYNDIASTTITDAINKADATVVVTPYDVNYDGGAHTAAVTTLTGVNGETGAAVGAVDVSNTTHTDAGTYAGDSWSFTGAANYNDVATTPITDVINKAASAVVVTINGGPFVYTGSRQTPAAVSVTGAGGLNLTPTAIYTNNVNAGTATASYTYAGDQNHTAGSDSKDFTIGKADATVLVAPYHLTYDGGAHVAAVASITGVNGQTGAAVGAVTLNTTHTNAGTYSDSWHLTGAANYNDVASTTITDQIDKAASKVVVTINGGPFTYTGLAQTPAAVSVTGAGLNPAAPKAIYANNVNAGTATASYTYAGDANHTGGSDSKNFTINKADATVVVTPYDVTYDGAPHKAAITSITGVNGETGAKVGAVDVSKTTHTDAGAYSGDSWSFAGANYKTINATTITDAVNKADAVVTITPYSGVYDGAAHGLTGSAAGVEASPANLTGLLHLGATFTNTPGGVATWTFDGNNNYNSQSGLAAVKLTGGPYLNPDAGDRAAAFVGLSAQQRVIQALYLDELGRAGAVDELNGWVAVLNGPNGQAAAAQAIENSLEGRDNLVRGWYQTYLGRAADGVEEQGWVAILQGGASEEAVLADVLGTQEFSARAQTLVNSGSPQERFVQSLYVLLLNRTAGADEIAGQVAALNGGQTQAQLAQAILQGQEFRADLVAQYYSTLLHRAGSAEEINGWAASGLSDETIRLMFESSPEFLANG